MKLFIKMMLISLMAITPYAVAHHAHADSSNVEAATKYVDSTAAEVLSILKSSSSKSKKAKQLEAVIKEDVDIDWIARFVVGKHWRTASKEQQKAFTRHYQDFILSSYAQRFTDFNGGDYKLLKSREDRNNKYTVKMSILLDGTPTTVDYKVRKKGSQFTIYDFVIEGVSLIATQRAEFNSIIQSKGLDYLIKKLASKSIAAPAAK